MKQFYTIITAVLFFATAAVSQQYDPPVTFDDSTINYDLTDFGGNYSSLEMDPAGSTEMVAKSTKSLNAEVWAGTTMGLNGFATALPFDPSNTKMSVRVYSPAVGLPIRLKVEDASNPAISVETEDTTTIANAWEILEFDFTNEVMGTAAINFANTYDKASMFFYFGTNGMNAGSDTVFYWDDVVFGEIGGTQIDLPVTFDNPNIDYTLTDFGGAASAVVTDPVGGANMVVRSVKEPGAMTWAGTVAGIGGLGFSNDIPLSSGLTTMSLRVYSPAAGIPVRFKVENASNGAIAVETEDTTTVANAWETLYFNMLFNAAGTPAYNPADTYDVAVVFFHFGTDGNSVGADSVFYWDDVEYVGTTSLVDNYERNISIYPNPASDMIRIQHEVKIQEVRIINMLGQEVYSSEFSNRELDINISELNKGKYIVHIRTKDGISTSKILKY